MTSKYYSYTQILWHSRKETSDRSDAKLGATTATSLWGGGRAESEIQEMWAPQCCITRTTLWWYIQANPSLWINGLNHRNTVWGEIQNKRRFSCGIEEHGEPLYSLQFCFNTPPLLLEVCPGEAGHSWWGSEKLVKQSTLTCEVLLSGTPIADTPESPGGKRMSLALVSNVQTC